MNFTEHHTQNYTPKRKSLNQNKLFELNASKISFSKYTLSLRPRPSIQSTIDIEPLISSQNTEAMMC